MMMGGSARTGVLVLRAWVEGEDGLRVRVAWSTHGAGAEQFSRGSATIDGVCDLVRAWLEGLLQETPPGSTCIGGDGPVTPE